MEYISFIFKHHYTSCQYFLNSHICCIVFFDSG